MDKILLIDGLNFIYRGNISFKSEKKYPYTVVYLFFKNLKMLIEQFNPNKVFFVLEGSNNFRYKLYSEYKANRKIIKQGSKHAVDNFDEQRDIIIELISSLPITIIKSDEFEADDVIATLIENLKDEELIVVSNDTDYIQLLQKGYKNLKIYNSIKKEYLEAPEYHYLVAKSLFGDKSDNIPGLVGQETAKKLLLNPDELQEFLSVDENRSNFNLNRELIELRIIDDDKLEFIEFETNFDLLKEEFLRMEFNSLLDDSSWKKFCNTFNNLR